MTADGGEVRAKLTLDTKDFDRKYNTTKKKIKEIGDDTEKSNNKIIDSNSKVVDSNKTVAKSNDEISDSVKKTPTQHPLVEQFKRARGEMEALKTASIDAQKYSYRGNMGGKIDIDTSSVANADSQLVQFRNNLKGASEDIADVKTKADSAGTSIDSFGSKASVAGDRASTGAHKSTSAFRLLHRASFLLEIAGGVMVGLFGFNLFQSFQQTVSGAMMAQQEMMGLFRQMGWGASQIKLVEDSLTNMSKEFKKVNKYQVGGIVANVAGMSKLSAEETAAMVKPAAMVYSQFLRGGRTPQDAQVAIREVVEGEFIRLSRETGVGQKDLKKAGWSGDVNDKVSMMEALEKIGYQKHWDLFAEKIQTLDDVMQLFGNSVSVVAVSIGQALLPAMVVLFVALSDVINGFVGFIQWLPGSAQIFIVAGAITALGVALLFLAPILSGMIMGAFATYVVGTTGAIIGSIGLAGAIDYLALSFFAMALSEEIATIASMGLMGALRLLFITIMTNPITWVIIAIIALVAIVYEVGKAFKLWTDLINFGEVVWNKFLQVLGAIYSAIVWVAKEFGILSGITYILNGAWRILSAGGTLIMNALSGVGEQSGIVGFIINGLRSHVIFLATGFKLVTGAVMGVVGWFNGLINAIFGVKSSGSLLTDAWNRFSIVLAGVSIIVGALQRAWSAFTSSFYDSEGNFVGVFEGLGNAFGKLWDWLSNIDWGAVSKQLQVGLMALGLRLADYLFGGEGPGIGEKIASWFEGIDWNQVMNKLVAGFAMYNPATMIVRLLFGDEAANAVALRIRQLYVVIRDSIMWLVGAIGNTIGAIKGVGDWIWDTLFGAKTQKQGGIFEVIKTWITDSLKNLGSSVIALISHYNPITLLAVYWFGEEQGKMVEESCSQFLWNIINVFVEWITLIYETFMGVADALTLIWTQIWITLGEVWNGIVTVAYAVWTPLYNFFTWLWNGIQSIVNIVWNNVVMVIYNGLMRVWSDITSVGTQIWGAMNSTMQRVWGAVSPYINLITSAWTRMRDVMVGAANYVRDNVTAAFKKVEDALRRVYNWVTHPFGSGSPAGEGAGAGLQNAFTIRRTAGLPGAGMAPNRSKSNSAGLFGWVTEGANNMVQSTTGINPGAGFGGDEDLADEYLGCTTQEDCKKSGAGWDFGPSLSNSIIEKVKNWAVTIGGTPFSLDSLTMGGSMSLFKAIAGNLIGRTRYDFYYGDKYSNKEAMSRGAFNCYDGAQILVALANSLGLSGGLVNGFWGSTPHTWASINGQAFDTTAYQHGRGWTGPAQRGAGASIGAGSSSNSQVINIEIPINGTVYDRVSLLREIKGAVNVSLNEVADSIGM